MSKSRSNWILNPDNLSIFIENIPKFVNTSTKSWGTILSTAPDSSLAQAFEYEFLTQYDLKVSSYWDSSKKLPAITSEESSSAADHSDKSMEEWIPDEIWAYTLPKKTLNSSVNVPIIVTPQKTSHSTKWMPIMNVLFNSHKDK